MPVLKQIFCFHEVWKPYSFWHPYRQMDYDIYECTKCGKVKAFKPGNPPVNKV